MKPLTFLTLMGTLALSAPLAAQNQASDASQEQAREQTALEMRAEQVIALINGEGAAEDIFTQGFLASVPPAQFAAISAQLTGQFGPAVAVEEIRAPGATRSAFAVRMERAIARGGIAIDPSEDDKISELLFQSVDPIGDTPAKIEADLAALPGDVAYWFGPIEGGEPVLASNAEVQMPLGSTFKLYVLAALGREIAEGRRKWNDVVTLTDFRSYPSGMMQDWPQGAQVTLETLASLMISISDNTATDALIDIVGREAVYQTVVDSAHSESALNNPFLKTREMFLLKAGPEGRLALYQRGDAETRSQILDGIADLPVPDAEVQAAFSGGPIALDVEWFGSAADLASLFRFMRETADPKTFEIMGINPSMNDNTRANWAYAGYKGGSEPGVLNLTWLLTDEEGRDHALVLSWRNDAASLDSSALEIIAQRILALPR